MRNPVPDFLKGIAVLLMIQVHVAEIMLNTQSSSDWVRQMALFFGGLPAAPIFMVIMGYYMAKSKSTGWAFLARALRLFGGGLLLNLGLNFTFLLNQWVEPVPFEGYSPWQYLLGVDILLFAGLATLIIGLLKKLNIHHPSFWMGMAVFAVLVAQFLPTYANASSLEGYSMAFIAGTSFWSYFPLFPWLAYPLTGVAFANYQSSYSNLPSFVRQTLGFLALGYFVWQFSLGFNVSIDLPTYYHHGLQFYLWALAGMGIWAIVAKFLLEHSGNGFIFRQVSRIGKRVTVIYVFQWLLIGNLASLGWYKTLSPLHYLGWSIGLSLAAAALGWLWLRLYASFRQNPGII
jgi:uncharacterized membrane protein